MGFQDFGNFHSRHPAIQTTRLLTFALAGLSPAEHTSVNWSRPSDILAVRDRAIDGIGLSPPILRQLPGARSNGSFATELAEPPTAIHLDPEQAVCRMAAMGAHAPD